MPMSGGQWRDRFLNEYESVGTYYNDHSGCWAPKGYATKCGGNMPKGPTSGTKKCVEANDTGAGECYFVDSTHSNSWRALRVNNATHNTQYIEYDSTWTFGDGPLQWYEYYDITKDPYQMTNAYHAQSGGVKAALHTELEAYYRCRGTQCP